MQINFSSVIQLLHATSFGVLTTQFYGPKNSRRHREAKQLRFKKDASFMSFVPSILVPLFA